MKIISFSNHKGGVGKTTSVVNIGVALTILNYKVLLIDLDPQCNLSQSLNVKGDKMNIYDVIKKKYKIDEIEVMKNLFIVPSVLDLSGAEIELSSEVGREFVLKEAINSLNSKFDFVLIDCPPSLGLLTINAFTASDELLIPIQAEYLALQGVTRLTDIISKIQQRLNKNLIFRGVFITQYDNRKVLNKDIAESISNYFNNLLFNTKIRDNISLAEAPVNGLDIFRYNNKCYGAVDYLALTKELLQKIN